MKHSNIFILDSNPLHRNLINYRLVTSGFTNVFSFHSVPECLYRFQKNVIPDFLITDYHTIIAHEPGFLEQVRTFSPRTKIIFFTEADNEEIAAGLIEEGAADYILKTKSLHSGVNELLKNIKYLSKATYFPVSPAEKP